eukprot:m.283821 g.283821  ORF g.283821 m.283821 type:complete len:3200 (+) comp17762_c0_seq1:56-9655(+)
MVFPRALWQLLLATVCVWPVGGSQNSNLRDVVLVLDDSIQMLSSWSNAKPLLDSAVQILDLTSSERDRLTILTLGATPTTVVNFANSSNASYVTTALADLSHGFAPVSSLEAGLQAINNAAFWDRSSTNAYVDRIVIVVTHASSIANPALQTQAAQLKALQVRLAWVVVPSTARSQPSTQLATALRNAGSQPPSQHYATFTAQVQLQQASERVALMDRVLQAIAIVSYEVDLNRRHLTLSMSRNVQLRSFNPTFLTLNPFQDSTDEQYRVLATNLEHVTNSSARDVVRVTLQTDDVTALLSQTDLVQAVSTTLLSASSQGLIADRPIVDGGSLTPLTLESDTTPYGVGAVQASNVTARTVQLSWPSPLETGGSLTRQQLWCNSSTAGPLVTNGIVAPRSALVDQPIRIPTREPSPLSVDLLDPRYLQALPTNPSLLTTRSVPSWASLVSWRWQSSFDSSTEGVILAKLQGMTELFRLQVSASNRSLYLHTATESLRFPALLTDDELHTVVVVLRNNTAVTVTVDDVPLEAQSLSAPLKDCPMADGDCHYRLYHTIGTGNTVRFPLNTTVANLTVAYHTDLGVAPPSPLVDLTVRDISTDATLLTRMQDILGNLRATTFERLLPATTYTCALRQFNAFGARLGPSQSFTTLPALPEAVDAPQATAITATSVLAVWTEPELLNGQLQRYSITLLRNTSVQAQQTTTNRSATFNNLAPFTRYCMRLTVTNQVGSTTASDTCFNTAASTPVGVVPPTVQNVAARTFNVSLTRVTALNGPSEIYSLEAERLASDSNTVLSSSLVYSGPYVAVVQATALLPATRYRLALAVSNGQATARQTSSVIQTSEDVPEQVPVPQVTNPNPSGTVVRMVASASLNGVLTSARLLLDRQIVRTATALPATLTLVLTPATNYVLQSQYCTAAGCTNSSTVPFRTSDAAPEGHQLSQVSAVDSRSLRVAWTAPTATNGVLQRYELHLTQRLGCNVTVPEVTRCGYATCSIGLKPCGESCYSPDNEVCCDGIVHPLQENHECCKTNYAPAHVEGSVCCGDLLVPALNGYECCNNRYQRLAPNTVCCNGQAVAGDACCGSVAYNSQDKLCCQDRLFDRFANRKCCGATVVATTQVCCGDTTAYSPQPGFACCGSSYAADTRLCCQTSSQALSHDVSTTTHSCCGTAAINTATQACPFRSTEAPNTLDTATCAYASSPATTACFTNQSAFAFCGSCDFSANEASCELQQLAPTLAAAFPNGQVYQSGTGVCDETTAATVTTASTTARSLTLTDLVPGAEYDVVLRAVGTGGFADTAASLVTMPDALPEGVQPLQVVQRSSSTLTVRVQRAKAEHGLVEYRIQRSGLVTLITVNASVTRASFAEGFFTLVDLQQLDVDTAYSLQLFACTQEGCTPSSSITASTLPTPLTSVALEATAITATRVALSAVLDDPKQEAHILRLTVSSPDPALTVLASGAQALVTGLNPYTSLNLSAEVCTVSGCLAAPAPLSVATLASAPAPFTLNVTDVGSRQATLTWSEPNPSNGPLLPYNILRNGQLLANQTARSFTDTTALPFTSYEYSIRAATSLGATISSLVTVLTEPALAEGIDTPSVVATTATTVTLQWDAVRRLNAATVVYQLYRNVSMDTPIYIGTSLQYQDTGLTPFTAYEYVLSVVNVAGEAVVRDLEGGPVTVKVTTGQSPPASLVAPRLVAVTANSLRAEWTPPLIPNGVVSAYTLEGRPVTQPASEPSSLVTTASPSTLVIDSLPAYSRYEVRLLVSNAGGTSRSSWVQAQTCSAAPSVSSGVTSSTSSLHTMTVQVHDPLQLNGPAEELAYLLTLAVGPQAITLNLTGSQREASFNSLTSDTTYTLTVQTCMTPTCGDASTLLCTTTSSTVRTLPAPPSDVQPPVATVLTPRSVALRWLAPPTIEGSVVGYALLRNGSRLYQGLATSFTDSSVVPLVPYTYTLELTTTGGVASSTAHTAVLTQPSLPQGLVAPTVEILELGLVDLSLRVCWSAPLAPGGEIEHYRLLVNGQSESQIASSLTCGTVANVFPDTSYTLRVEACTEFGCAASPSTSLTTPCRQATVPTLDVPDVTATTAELQWSVINARCSQVTFELQYSEGSLLSTNPVKLTTQTPRLTLTNLLPNTAYAFTLTVRNSAANVTSSLQQFQTASAPPAVVTSLVASALSSTTIRLSWNEPGSANGDIVSITVLQDTAALTQAVARNATETDVSGLSPFTSYSFQLLFCTDGGCTPSVSVNRSTLQGVPLELGAPVISSVTASAMVVSWAPPLFAQGVVQQYQLEVEQCRSANLTNTVADLPSERVCSDIPSGTEVLSFSAATFTTTLSLQAYQHYRVRVLATNAAATTTSDWAVTYAQVCEVGSDGCPTGVQEVPLRALPGLPIATGALRCTVPTVPTALAVAVRCEWSGSFDLQGPLNFYRFEVLSGSQVQQEFALQSTDTTVTVSAGTTRTFRVTVQTPSGQANISVTEGIPVAVGIATTRAIGNETVVIASSKEDSVEASLIGIPILIVVLIIFLVGAYYYTAKDRSKTPDPEPATELPTISRQARPGYPSLLGADRSLTGADGMGTASFHPHAPNAMTAAFRASLNSPDEADEWSVTDLEATVLQIRRAEALMDQSQTEDEFQQGDSSLGEPPGFWSPHVEPSIPDVPPAPLQMDPSFFYEQVDDEDEGGYDGEYQEYDGEYNDDPYNDYAAEYDAAATAIDWGEPLPVDSGPSLAGYGAPLQPLQEEPPSDASALLALNVPPPPPDSLAPMRHAVREASDAPRIRDRVASDVSVSAFSEGVAQSVALLSSQDDNQTSDENSEHSSDDEAGHSSDDDTDGEQQALEAEALEAQTAAVLLARHEAELAAQQEAEERQRQEEEEQEQERQRQLEEEQEQERQRQLEEEERAQEMKRRAEQEEKDRQARELAAREREEEERAAEAARELAAKEEQEERARQAERDRLAKEEQERGNPFLNRSEADVFSQIDTPTPEPEHEPRSRAGSAMFAAGSRAQDQQQVQQLSQLANEAVEMLDELHRTSNRGSVLFEDRPVEPFATSSRSSSPTPQPHQGAALTPQESFSALPPIAAGSMSGDGPSLTRSQSSGASSPPAFAARAAAPEFVDVEDQSPPPLHPRQPVSDVARYGAPPPSQSQPAALDDDDDELPPLPPADSDSEDELPPLPTGSSGPAPMDPDSSDDELPPLPPPDDDEAEA